MTGLALGVLGYARRPVVFLAWAVTLIVLLKWGTYRAFLRPELGVLLQGAYLILIVVLVAELFRREPRPRAASLLAPAVLLVPLVFVLNGKDTQLDAYVLHRRLTGTPRLTAPSGAPSPGAGGPDLGPIGLMFRQETTISALYAQPEQYDGKLVTVVGMAFSDEGARKEFGAQALLVFRFKLSCCAADARPLTLVVLPHPLASAMPIPDSTWVSVQGRFTLRKVPEGSVPVIEDAMLSPAEPPARQYL